jgi:pterin-4a-carbinolamine dehydratase
MASLPLWTLAADGKAISRELVAKNWQAAMSFLNAVSAIAEEEGHHPDLHLTGWRNVRVELSTHAIGGLSMPDMVLAAKIDVRAPGPPSKPRVRSQNPPQSVTTHGAPLLGIAQTIPTVYSPKWLRESGVGAILDAAAGSELKSAWRRVERPQGDPLLPPRNESDLMNSSGRCELRARLRSLATVIP